MSKQEVIRAYRYIANLVKLLPEAQQANGWKQLREGFRKNATQPQDQVPHLLKIAEDRAAFLRIVTPKNKNRDGDQTESRRYVYTKNGEVDKDGKVTRNDIRAMVSNWDGNNLDPCSVKRHYQGLKRCGFRNNLHAKGIF